MPDYLQNTTTEVLPSQILSTFITLNKHSEEKYEKKTNLIEKAADMSTQEKSDALDRNYNRHRQEMLQNCAVCILSMLALCGFGYASPSIIRSVKSLAHAAA